MESLLSWRIFIPAKRVGKFYKTIDTTGNLVIKSLWLKMILLLPNELAAT